MKIQSTQIIFGINAMISNLARSQIVDVLKTVFVLKNMLTNIYPIGKTISEFRVTTNALLLQKIEELTLYVIELEKKVETITSK